MQNNFLGPAIIGDGRRDFKRGILDIEFDGENALVKEELNFGEAKEVQSQVHGVNMASFQQGLPPSSTVVKLEVEIHRNGMVMHKFNTKVKG